jgi:hypothetical protein
VHKNALISYLAWLTTTPTQNIPRRRRVGPIITQWAEKKVPFAFKVTFTRCAFYVHWLMLLEPPDFFVVSRGRRVCKCFFCYLMFQKKIELFCTEWIQMTLCLLRCLLCLDFISCISWLSPLMRQYLFGHTLNLLRLIHHDQISLFRAPPRICIEFLGLSSGFLGCFCLWIIFFR